MKASKAGDHFLLSLGGKGLTDRYNCKEKLDACHCENKKGEESRFTKKKLALNKYVMSLCIRNSECPIL